MGSKFDGVGPLCGDHTDQTGNTAEGWVNFSADAHSLREWCNCQGPPSVYLFLLILYFHAGFCCWTSYKMHHIKSIQWAGLLLPDFRCQHLRLCQTYHTALQLKTSPASHLPHLHNSWMDNGGNNYLLKQALLLSAKPRGEGPYKWSKHCFYLSFLTHMALKL